MAHYLLFYNAGPNYLERRAPLRVEHLRLLREANARGELLLAGALADPVDGAVLLFQSDGPEVAERFARSDPYVLEGLIESWSVRRWSTVVGDGSTPP